MPTRSCACTASRQRQTTSEHCFAGATQVKQYSVHNVQKLQVDARVRLCL